MIKYEKDYVELCHRLFKDGEWIANERTGKRCLTLINHDFVYDVAAGEVPLLTTKQCFPVSAAAEVLGYYRRYTNAQQFADIGTKSWFQNANETEAWLNNPNRCGENDLGIIYGAATEEAELRNIYNDLLNGVDNRGEIYQMWKPETFHRGCLRPCVYEHIWSLVNGKLSLTVTQRSADVPLGIPFNSFSFAFLLKLMAKITGTQPDKVYHKMVNVHIYEDQVEPLKQQLEREPLDVEPVLEIEDWVRTLDDVLDDDVHAREYFNLYGYGHLGKINFNMSA